MFNRISLGLLGLLLAAAPAAAQEGIQIGAGTAAVHLRRGGDFWGEGLHHAGGEVRVSLPLAERWSIEMSSTFGRRTLDRGFTDRNATIETSDIRRSEKLFSVAVKQNLGRDTHSHAFLVYGLAGFSGTTHYPETRVSYPNGNRYVYGASTSTQKSQWAFPQFGAGFEKNVSKRLTLRGDVRSLLFLYWPVGVRASFSVGYTFRRL
jgi:hypothetical protein